MRGLIRRIQNRGYATLARIADHLDSLTAGDESNAVLEALEKLKNEPIDPERVQAAKVQMRADRLKSMQTAEAIAYVEEGHARAKVLITFQ